MVKSRKKPVKKRYKKRPAKLTTFERRFAGKFVKKGGVSEFKRVLRARWWIGRMSSKKR